MPTFMASATFLLAASVRLKGVLGSPVLACSNFSNSALICSSDPSEPAVRTENPSTACLVGLSKVHSVHLQECLHSTQMQRFPAYQVDSRQVILVLHGWLFTLLGLFAPATHALPLIRPDQPSGPAFNRISKHRAPEAFGQNAKQGRSRHAWQHSAETVHAAHTANGFSQACRHIQTASGKADNAKPGGVS